jgi:hypothetical protein
MHNHLRCALLAGRVEQHFDGIVVAAQACNDRSNQRADDLRRVQPLGSW